MLRLVCAVALTAVTLSAAQFGKPRGMSVKPERDWVGLVSDNKLAKEAPKGGVLVDAKAFEKVWKAWRKDEKLPEIDFTRKLVVVGLSLGGPNRPTLSAALDENGNLSTRYISTLIGGPGFGYSLAVFDRKGIKTINGKAIPKS